MVLICWEIVLIKQEVVLEDWFIVSMSSHFASFDNDDVCYSRDVYKKIISKDNTQECGHIWRTNNKVVGTFPAGNKKDQQDEQSSDIC